jgi:hypothetical protein
MLVDLRDFTLISDALAPTNVIKMLNRYFDSVMFPHPSTRWRSDGNNG